MGYCRTVPCNPATIIVYPVHNVCLLFDGWKKRWKSATVLRYDSATKGRCPWFLPKTVVDPQHFGDQLRKSCLVLFRCEQVSHKQLYVTMQKKNTPIYSQTPILRHYELPFPRPFPRPLFPLCFRGNIKRNEDEDMRTARSMFRGERGIGAAGH
jgi:hypothetical protein